MTQCYILLYNKITRNQEHTQTDVGIQQVKEWAKMTGLLTDDDLLISADVDEILYPTTLQLLRWCEVRKQSPTENL